MAEAKTDREKAAQAYIDSMAEVPAALEEKGGIFGRIIGAIGQFFTGWIPAAVSSVTHVIPVAWNNLIEDIADREKKRIAAEVIPGLKKLLTDRKVPPELQGYLMSYTEQSGLWAGFFSLAVNLLMMLGDVRAFTDVLSDETRQRLGSQVQNTLPEAGSAIKAMFINPALEAKVREVLKRYGLSTERSNMMIAAARAQLDVGTIQALLWRGELTEDQVYERMRALGYSDERTDELKKTWAVIPGPQDIIRMAVREAFSEEQVTALGLDERFPQAVAEWAAKVGLKEPWPRMFWRAHWELPSAQMGFEMLHRGVITEDELKALLVALDYSPRWHAALERIAYNVVTRVDARRLYELGVWTEERLTEEYKRMGYAPLDAEDLTAWTKVEYAQGDKEVTRSQIEKAYNAHIVTRSEAVGMLTELGWSPERSEWILDVADFTARTAVRDETIATIKELYIAGLATALEARQRLGEEQVDPQYIEVLLERWDTAKLTTRRLPSKSDLDKFLKGGLIEEREYKQELQRLGYSDVMADRYYRLNTA